MEWGHYASTDYLNINVHKGGAGYVFTGGKCVPVSWKKDGDFGPTRYYDSEGKEVMLNKGKTWICIVGADRYSKAVPGFASYNLTGWIRRNFMENRQSRRKTKGKRESNFVVQGSILAVASIVVRIIGIAYRIPMINIIGDEGMGYYGTAFNVYNIALLLSSYSLPLAVSKMVSARLAGKQYRNAARILRAALCYATIVGAFAAAVIWFGADFFAKDVFFMPYAAFALRTLAPTVWIMAYLAVFRGYFQGQGTMVPTAFSQVFEQIVNAIVSVAAGSFLFNEALKTEVLKNQTGDGYSNAWGAAGGTIGTGAGAFTALIFLLFLFAACAKMRKRQIRRDQTEILESYRDITRILFFTVVPVILSSAIYNLNSVLDNGILAYNFKTLGQGDEFASIWGVPSADQRADGDLKCPFFLSDPVRIKGGGYGR